MLKLSEAIRLGAMLRRKATGAFFHKGGSCAMGAAVEATGFQYDEKFCAVTLHQHFDTVFPNHSYINQLPCPQCGCVDLIGTIAHLNDYPHWWTRERIADWVATIEPKDVPASSIEQAQSGRRGSSDVEPSVIVPCAHTHLHFEGITAHD